MNTVKQFMERGVQTLSETSTLIDAQVQMEKFGCLHLPVVNSEQKVVGLISHRDLQLALPSPLFPINEDGLQPDAIPVTQIMWRDLITVSPDTGLRQAAMFLRNQKIGCLPVVDNGKLVGIITNTDYLNIAVALLEGSEHLEPIAV